MHQFPWYNAEGIKKFKERLGDKRENFQGPSPS